MEFSFPVRRLCCNYSGVNSDLQLLAGFLNKDLRSFQNFSKSNNIVLYLANTELFRHGMLNLQFQIIFIQIMMYVLDDDFKNAKDKHGELISEHIPSRNNLYGRL
ncbi:MAG TPA: hypothetical protein VFG25_01470 [Nitrosopumilaceae archaeon]|nr:hypothetical protein [Nitrosopumilaceae archaeon]